MSLNAEFQNTVAELKAEHGNCFKSGFREFKKSGFVFHYQFTKPASNRSKIAIKQRLDLFSIRAKSRPNNLEKSV